MKQKLLFTLLFLVALISNSYSQQYYYYRGLANDNLSNDSCWFTVRGGNGISLAGHGFAADKCFYVIGCEFAETKAPWTVCGYSSKIIVGDAQSSTSTTLNVINGNTITGVIDLVPSGMLGQYTSKVMFSDPVIPTINSIGTNCTIAFSSPSGTQIIPSMTYYNIEISGAGTKILQGDITVDNSITITGANLEVDLGIYQIQGTGTFLGYGNHTVLKTSHPLGIVGNFNNSGSRTFSASLGYNFYGSTPNQPTGFSSLGITLCDYLEISNTNGVALDNPLTVATNIKLTGGILSLGSNNLELSQICTFSGNLGENNNIKLSGTGGTIKKNFLYDVYSPLVIPISDSKGRFSPVTINAFTSGSTAGYFIFNTVGIKDPNNTSITNFLKKYWLITAGDFTTAPTVTMTFQYNSTYDISGSESLLVGGMYNGGMWSPLTNVNTTSHTFMAINKTIAANKSTTVHFTAGEDGVMPVHLNSLTSSVTKNDVKLNWQTASEINNSGFEIYRKLSTSDDFVKVGFVKGSGTVNTPTKYSYSDRNLATGKYSYKIKQIDYNGNFEYFALENDVIVGIPANYELSQNYPNPFNPSTKINFSIPKDQRVSLKIYDMLGKETATIVNEYKAAGFYTVEFNASNLTSGIYFYVLRGDNFTQTKKMTLIK